MSAEDVDADLLVSVEELQRVIRVRDLVQQLRDLANEARSCSPERLEQLRAIADRVEAVMHTACSTEVFHGKPHV